MTIRSFTLDDQIKEVEALIAELRQVHVGTRRLGIASRLHTSAVLKTIAEDLRGRRPGVPGAALAEMQRLLADAAASRTESGWSAGALRGIAQYVIGHWATFRQALERFNEESKS